MIPAIHQVCGEYGGYTEAGDSCGRPAGEGTVLPGFGRCRRHEVRPETRFDNPRKNAFLTVYRRTKNITASAQAAGLHRSTHYDWCNPQEPGYDPRYVDALAEAEQIANDFLQLELRRRALIGVLEPVYYQGEVVGYNRKLSDVLLIVALKQAGLFNERPAEQRDDPLDVARQIRQAVRGEMDDLVPAGP
jgi:hypothetical protein